MNGLRLPATIRQRVNKLAHQLARVEEIRLRQGLTDRAVIAMREGLDAAGVLALLNSDPRARGAHNDLTPSIPG